MSNETIYLLFLDSITSRLLENVILKPAGYHLTVINDIQIAIDLIKVNSPDILIIGENSSSLEGLELVDKLLNLYPTLALIYLPVHHDPQLEIKALQYGVFDYLIPPVRPNEVLAVIERALNRKRRLENWIRLECKRNTKSLQSMISGLEALQQVGQKVTSLLDLDNVLKAVVDAAVELTGAEEGSLLLLEETTGELYMHAARNFNEDFVRTFRLPIHDTLPGQVLKTGKPLVFNQETPLKITTSYLVHTLIYVPLQVNERIIGVLGVDNRQGGNPFKEEHVPLVSAFAGYAAIAIENARLYTRTELERKKLETILTHIEDGVLVFDKELQLILINQAASAILDIESENLLGNPAESVLKQLDLLELILDHKNEKPSHAEITLENGRIFTAQITPIPEVGLAITMQDITHLKELDRIKSDFVSTVSHDLRSPLTAILGYVELIGRAGPINEQQREFIRRVQFSVNNITSLINDLLDLGRIEAGFDTQKEVVPLSAIINYSAEGFRSRIEEKNLNLVLDYGENLPNIFGNPIRLRQMVSNLLGNAVKYTPNGGLIALTCHSEEDQIILHIKDNGPGIPVSEHPYIFDKFYRASNIPSDTPGTGLGLAIVKSIVENHQGRIWVESALGQGTTFTVVLPIINEGS